jgi:mRNA interferase MazF
MVIKQGDIFWIDLDEGVGSSPSYRHPHVVIQNNAFNASNLNTVVVCTLSSNLNRAQAKGNVLIAQGEANLPKPSVVIVSQIFTVDKSQLTEYIGTLSSTKILQIIRSISLLLEPLELEKP